MITQATSTTHLVAAGLTTDPTFYPSVKRYIEHVQNGLPSTTFSGAVPIPTSIYAKVEATGYRQQWSGLYEYYVYNHGMEAVRYLPNQTGCAQAYSEAKNDGGYNVLATTFFGTNTSGYNGSGYALNLKNMYHNWYLWNTSLPAEGTYIETRFNPPYYYSPHSSYRHYYFGTWNRS
ncbi:MAG: hypothetical protein Q7W44_00355 [Coriobacteriia bacterium]|nr:hypothetical protein [Coriobacteriia bacterium]